MNIKSGTYKVEIEDNNEFWYNSNGICVHYKSSTGYKEWREYDAKGNMIHYKDSIGYEKWYDANGKLIHFKDSNGKEFWRDSNGNKISKEQFDAIHNSAPCNGKVIEVEGKKYKLIAV